MMTKAELVEEYKPYSDMPEFYEGWNDYMLRNMRHHACNPETVAEQAYDRGCEAAMRWHRR